MALFDANPANADKGYLNLRAAQDDTTAGQIRVAVEEMWESYQPYADTDFGAAFAIHPDESFWEMYLALMMLRGRKKLRRRDELAMAQRNTGPDICIQKGKRRIWIEAACPEPGDENSPDRVPNLIGASADEKTSSPRRQIELRITGALARKAQRFEEYRANRIVGEKDSCIVAVSAGQFALQAAGEVLPHAITALYPFGAEISTLDPLTGTIRTQYAYSNEIAKLKGKNVARTAFQHEQFKGISGLIWSLRSIGNFLGRADDLLYLHNQMAARPIPRRWFKWAEEYFPTSDGAHLKRRRRRRRMTVLPVR